MKGACSPAALCEEFTGRALVGEVGHHSCITVRIVDRRLCRLHGLEKRAIDIILASIGLLFLLPFTALIALAIYIDSPGPILYSQERVGLGGRRFTLWKFRSMRVNAENGKAVWAQKNDSRVTRVGRILRRTHVDEFPQFWNVLKGEMSVIGPRPERPEFTAELEKVIPSYRVRHTVKPGMAGWGLVCQGYGGSETEAWLKLQYDLYYIKHRSTFFDVVILLKSVIHMVAFRGR